MTSEDSRKIPTTQGKSVGNFQLAQPIGKSDKSVMPSTDQIRLTLRRVLADAGHSPIAVARELGRGRDYLRDFLAGKKRTIDTEISVALSERYNIPLKDLTPTRDVATMIRKGAKPHYYIVEHMDRRGFDDADMAARIDGIDADTFRRWRANQADLQAWQLLAILHAFGMEEEVELTRMPPPKRAHASTRQKQRKRA